MNEDTYGQPIGISNHWAVISREQAARSEEVLGAWYKRVRDLSLIGVYFVRAAESRLGEGSIGWFSQSTAGANGTNLVV